MLRFINTFFRFWWLWLLPAIALPVAFSVWLINSSTYTATASLWVEKPLFSGENDVAIGGYNWQSPAQQMAGLFSELMGTRSFVNSVIDNTSLKSTVKSETERLDTIDSIRMKTIISSDKFRLISLSFTARESNVAVEVLNQEINQFRTYYNDKIGEQGEKALAYYQKNLESARTDLDKATQELKDFIARNPNQVSDNGNRAVTEQGLVYQGLLQNLESARKRYDDANTAVDKVYTDYGAVQQGQVTTLRIQDSPDILINANSKVRQAATGVIIGLILTALIALAGTILLTLRDKTIRYGFYARQVLEDDRVMELPNYMPAKARGKNLLPGRVTYVEGGKKRQASPDGIGVRQDFINHLNWKKSSEVSNDYLLP